MQTTFSTLGLSEPILRAVTNEGYTTPTPIQAQAIPHVLAGKDVLGCAQTGTGKTAAFALPMLHRLAASVAASAAAAPAAPAPAPNAATTAQAHRGQNPRSRGGHHSPPRAYRPIRALILSPTRELALQIEESFKVYGRHTGLNSACVFGGVGQNPQVRALKQGIDVLVATPGRLLDLMNQGFVDLKSVETFVLDEADRMLDMGFINDIRKIIAKLPHGAGSTRQTLLFSATMPTEIRKLADSLLKNPVSVQVTPVASTAERVGQSVFFVSKTDKPRMLVHFINTTRISRVLVFTRTKHGADRVERHLNKEGIAAEAIHGNKRQNARVKTMENFRSGRTAVLVATDIAARGIDIDDISHVVNFDLPNEPETYVHRIGRTGRAGAEGKAVSFCDRDERGFLKDIERLTRSQIPVEKDVPQFDPLPRSEVDAERREFRAHRDQGRPTGGGYGGGHSGGSSHHRSQSPRPQAPHSQAPRSSGHAPGTTPVVVRPRADHAPTGAASHAARPAHSRGPAPSGPSQARQGPRTGPRTGPSSGHRSDSTPGTGAGPRTARNAHSAPRRGSGGQGGGRRGN